eukprot:9501821-Pyramimonas_sp.AAC.1
MPRASSSSGLTSAGRSLASPASLGSEGGQKRGRFVCALDAAGSSDANYSRRGSPLNPTSPLG